MRALLPAAVALMAALAACDKRPQPAAPTPPIPPAVPALVVGPVSYISVSDSNPAVGSAIVVAGNVTPENAHGVASFRARLQYDPAGLAYVEEVPIPGMMRALNPQPGQIIVAGASAAATSDPRLFSVRFRVRDPRALGTLTLVVDELNDAGYSSQLKALKPLASVRLDRSLNRVAAQPPK